MESVNSDDMLVDAVQDIGEDVAESSAGQMNLSICRRRDAEIQWRGEELASDFFESQGEQLTRRFGKTGIVFRNYMLYVQSFWSAPI
jgi:hypothetical protein